MSFTDVEYQEITLMNSKTKPAAKLAGAAKAKPSAKKAPAKAVKKVAETKADKLLKPQLVRDSFTIPESEYATLAKVKKACLKDGFEIKKSELIRIGIAMLESLSISKVKSAKKKLQTVKTGRPRKHK
jgi:hypothetical protein